MFTRSPTRSRVPAIAQEASMLAFHAALITSSLSLTGN
jgi:hypothetical protein